MVALLNVRQCCLHNENFQVQEGDTDLLSVLSPAAVKTLDDAGSVSEDESKASGSGNHGDHGQPEVGHVLGREATVANTQHVGHGLE